MVTLMSEGTTHSTLQHKHPWNETCMLQSQAWSCHAHLPDHTPAVPDVDAAQVHGGQLGEGQRLEVQLVGLALWAGVRDHDDCRPRVGVGVAPPLCGALNTVQPHACQGARMLAFSTCVDKAAGRHATSAIKQIVAYRKLPIVVQTLYFKAHPASWHAASARSALCEGMTAPDIFCVLTRNPGWGHWHRMSCSQRARQRSRRDTCPYQEFRTHKIPVHVQACTSWPSSSSADDAGHAAK